MATVDDLEKRIAPAEYTARQRMRSFGSARTKTLIGMRLSNCERAMIGSRYANLPGKIERTGEKESFGGVESGTDVAIWRPCSRAMQQPSIWRPIQRAMFVFTNLLYLGHRLYTKYVQSTSTYEYKYVEPLLPDLRISVTI